MSTNTLEDSVEAAVNAFVIKNQAFTALDISNEVKKSVSVRHRDVQPLVVSMYVSGKMPSYNKEIIEVHLANGTTVDAVCYHHSNDTNDLDTAYPMWKRMASPTRPNVPAAQPHSQPTLSAGSASVGMASSVPMLPSPTPAQGQQSTIIPGLWVRVNPTKK